MKRDYVSGRGVSGPVRIFRYRGILLRIVDNGLKGWDYEWTIGQRGDRRQKVMCHWRTAGGRRGVDPSSSGRIDTAIKDGQQAINEMLDWWQPQTKRQFWNQRVKESRLQKIPKQNMWRPTFNRVH